MKTKIIDFEIEGIKSPRINIRGLLHKKEEIIIKIDGKKVDYEDVCYSGHHIVFKDYSKTPQFFYHLKVPKKSKKLDIYVKSGKESEIIFTKNINIVNCILNEITKMVSLAKTIFKQTLRIMKKMMKNFKSIFSVVHMKQYYKEWRYMIGMRHIEKKYYLPTKENDYLNWLKLEKSGAKIKLDYTPLISVLIPVYNADKKHLEECIESVLNQTYENFEVCIADDKSINSDTLEVLKKYENYDERIKILYRKKNGHISEATNSALEIATGEYVALLDNDDVLTSDALYEVVKVLNENKKLDLIYSDEDKISLNGAFVAPHFKPGYSPNTLLSSNYICHFLVLRKRIVDELGGFRSEYDGAQDHDLLLRFTEKSNNIYHISKVLYHWRESNNSTALNNNNKSYALEAGKKAIKDALKRRKIKADVDVVEGTGKYFVKYKIEKEPKISIIIPTKNRADILECCLKSIYEKTNYENFEIIVIDNNSDEKSLFELLDSYTKKYDNFKSYRYECEFNYSYLNNEACKKSTGDYIVLLNNDTEIINADWLKIMVGYAMQDSIGCVGVKLLYPSGKVQHVGVVTGLGGVASHIYVNAPDNEYGYYGYLASVRDVKVVTAACLMVKKSIYEELGGLDEHLKVAYNDVDFNIRVRKKGYYNVIIPQVKLYHYESISRGSDLTEKTKARFIGEIKYVVDKLGQDLMNDEFYNDNFSKDYCYVLDRRD